MTNNFNKIVYRENIFMTLHFKKFGNKTVINGLLQKQCNKFTMSL